MDSSMFVILFRYHSGTILSTKAVDDLTRCKTAENQWDFFSSGGFKNLT
jgi:hypothetical protein